MSNNSVQYTIWPRSNFCNAAATSSPAASFWWDAFDEIDWSLFDSAQPAWIQWLNKPEWLNSEALITPTNPMKKVLQKWRVVIDISGFTFPAKNIKIELKPNNKLFIWGKEEVKENEENLWYKEFKRSFDLPHNVEAERFVSFIWGNLLIVEVPIRDATPGYSMKELLPVFDTHKKELNWNVTLPMPPVDQSKIDIVVKDRDVIIKFWDTTIPQPHTAWTTWWGAWIYKRVCSLPENTVWQELKFTFVNNVLTIWAPLWDWEQWQHKTTTVMPSLVDWSWNWKHWSSGQWSSGNAGAAGPWTSTPTMWTPQWSNTKTDIKSTPWSWPHNSPSPWWPQHHPQMMQQ